MAELRLADAEFGAKQYLQAIDGYKLFIKFHPTHDMVINGYAAYRIGEAYYKMLPGDWWLLPPSYEKDQSATADAHRQLGSFLKNYPKSAYRNKAAKRLSAINEKLASHEMYVAKFYWDRERRWEPCCVSENFSRTIEALATIQRRCSCWAAPTLPLRCLPRLERCGQSLSRRFQSTKTQPKLARACARCKIPLDDEAARQLAADGRRHFERGDYDAALECLEKIREETGGFADLLNMLGVIYHSREQFDEAEQAFERALAINPAYTDAALNLSVTYNDRGKYREAREIYTMAVERAAATRGQDEAKEGAIDPFVRGKISNMHAELGDAYADILHYEDAIREYEQALSMSPSFVDIRTRLGNVLREAGRPEEAVAHYRMAKAQRPEFLPARLALGVTLFSLKRREEAIAEWRECVSFAPADRRATVYLRMVEAPAGAPEPGSALPDPQSL